MLKRIAAVVAALSLVIGMTSVVSAGTWKTYFGLNKGWYEGTEGKLTTNSSNAWTAKVQSIGWGGCWGGQIHKSASIKKGKTYTLKCTLKSSKLDKYVYVKIGDAKGQKMNLGKWVDCKKGTSVTVSETFTAKYDGNSIYFGIGGDFGDREPVKTDEDAKVRYKYASDKKLDSRLGSDAAADHPTIISCTGFSLAEASTANSNGTANGTATNNGTANTVSTTDSTVSTGVFTPITCAVAAVVAAAVVVVFAKRRKAK